MSNNKNITFEQVLTILNENNGQVRSDKIANLAGVTHPYFVKKMAQILCGAEWDDVKRDLEAATTKCENLHLVTDTVQRGRGDGYDVHVTYYLLNERQMMLMAMAFSHELQAAVYDAYEAYKATLIGIAIDPTDADTKAMDVLFGKFRAKYPESGQKATVFADFIVSSITEFGKTGHEAVDLIMHYYSKGSGMNRKELLYKEDKVVFFKAFTRGIELAQDRIVLMKRKGRHDIARDLEAAGKIVEKKWHSLTKGNLTRAGTQIKRLNEINEELASRNKRAREIVIELVDRVKLSKKTIAMLEAELAEHMTAIDALEAEKEALPF